MIIFAQEKIDEVKEGKLVFYKLRVDGICLYDEFCEKMEKNPSCLKSLNMIRAYMNFMAESDKMLPSTKFNSIKGKNNVIGYEFKHKELRVYIVKQEPNVYVVLGGIKSSQKKDIAKFAEIIKDFQLYIQK